MEDKCIEVYIVTDSKFVKVPYTNTTNIEDVCILLCKQLGIGPVARHLFALRVHGTKLFIALNNRISEKNKKYDLRIRYKVANTTRLKKVDIKAYDYYFHQARNDVLDNNIPDIIYEKYKRELVGLGVADMYRVMLEKDIARDIVENDYKKYIPKEVIKRHSFFIKKPIHDSLGKIKKSGHDAWYVKAEYLKQLEVMAPEYLAEDFTAVMDVDGSVCNVYIKVSPFHRTEPGIRICYDSKKEEWKHLCKIGDLCFVSVRNDGTVEISRKNGIPSYLKFQNLNTMSSFVSILDGYYRLMIKWTFNLCKDFTTPSLQKLYSMKCHGPVGGEFSYAKLEEKRSNRAGCFILRESETKYSTFYIDVSSKQSLKPKSYKLETTGTDEFIFNDDLCKYKTIQLLISAYKDPEGTIYLQECLPPSEYDKSPLLLCQPDTLAGESLTDSSAICNILPSAPLCINTKDLQVYKGIIFGQNNTVNKTDFSICKLSHLGLEFFGTIAKTESGVRCQSWKTNNPIHKVDESFTDDMFPERSMQKSKNYCRNPNRNPAGPWCYTMDQEIIDETCGIPLCAHIDCKLTGPGMDYAGKYNRGVSGRKCLKWDKHRKKVKSRSGTYEQKKFSKRKFPDETRGAAKKYCRNPDGDIGGPWCFVAMEDSDNVEKEYCNIPLCDDQICMVFTKSSSEYTHYTKFNQSITNLTFSIKSWNPDNIFETNARLLLTLLPLPLTGDEIDNMQIGIEIYISNNNSAMTVGNKNTVDYEPTLNIISASKFTTFSLMWDSGFVTLNLDNVATPIFLAEYKFKEDLFGVHKNRFFYYSLQGTNILWALPLCDEAEECEIHITTTENNERYWPIHKTKTGRELLFNVRAFHSALIILQTSPTVEYPKIKIMLCPKDNRTKIIFQEFEKGPESTLGEQEILNLLNFWEWQEFTITIFSQTLQIYWKRDMSIQMIIEVNDKFISTMRWFSPASDDSVIYWTFYCAPPETEAPPKPLLPECALNQNENDYVGTQWVTNQGFPCAPWIADDSIVNEIGTKKATKYWNYCRDLLNEKQGTYCNAISKTGITQTKCKLRPCQSSECRIAGTGNDYIGKLNITRSNRTCQKWTAKKPHNINPHYLHNDLYPDQNVSKAENFCRDPNRNVSGPWCYTTDVNVPMDLCNVKDCAKKEECIIMTMGNGIGRNTYILPQWKERGVHGGLFFSLKEWNPDFLDGIKFEITPLTGKGWIQLFIGADKNEKVRMYYGNNRKDAKVVKEKTLPHLIPSGKWGAFWLQIRKGEIMLGYQGVPDPLFKWQHKDIESAFEPMFLTYMSIESNVIGVDFKCDECHTERTEISTFTRIMPLGLWLETSNDKYRNISFYIRGTGVAVIPLMLLPGSGLYYAVTIGDFGSWIIFIWNGKQEFAKNLKAKNLTTEKPIEVDKWTYYTLSYSEFTMEILRNNISILKYTSKKAMLFYWFSLGAENGWVTWSANCPPQDIDGPPRDGGWSAWSPWICTVTCGGGDGYRTRTCSNPRPNVYGKLCEGSTTYTGRCNEFECGDLSPATINKIRNHLKTQTFSFVIDEGSKIILENDRELLDLIETEAPEAYYEWTLNGLYITPIPDQIEFVGDNIVINEAATSDTGIYVSMLYRINKKRIILRVISLAVKPTSYSLVTRKSYDITLFSNAVILGYVYSDLSQKWILNNNVYIDYGITTLAAVNTEHIESVNDSHNGLWQCVVEQNDLQLSWVTNIINVQVKKAPNILTHMMEDKWPSKIFGKLNNEWEVLLVLMLIIIAVSLLVTCFTVIYLKWGTLPKTNIFRKKNDE